MKNMDIKLVAINIEDKLIENFNLSSRHSYAIITNGKYVIESYFDEKTLDLDIYIFGNKAGIELYNVQNAIKEAISIDKILNEVHLEDSRLEWEWEAEMDNRRHLSTHL